MPLNACSREQIVRRIDCGRRSLRREATHGMIAVLTVLLACTILLHADAQTVPAQKSGHSIDGLEHFIPAQMQTWKVPGLAIAVVQDGQVIYSRGFGLRDVKGKLPVTSKTIFAIGSISKSFTSLSMGILKASWIGTSRCGNICRNSRCMIPWPASA